MVNAKKKICIVVASPLTIRFFLVGQIKAIAEQYDVTIVTNTNDPKFLEEYGLRVRVFHVAMERNVSLFRDFKALIHLTYILYRENFDVVHSLSPKSGLLAMAASWLRGTSVRIHTFQGEVWVTRTGLWRKFLKFLDKLVVRFSTHLLVVSSSEENFLVAEGVVKPGRLKIVAKGSICGVDIERFRPNLECREKIRRSFGIREQDFVVLYVGRKNRDKGLLDLTQAFLQVKRKYQGLHLMAVGPDENEMEEEILALCGEGNTRLHLIDYTDCPEQYMAAADVLCLPSYREGFGLVLIEAAAVGIPTVASRIYGIVDAVVDKETGLLFGPGNIDELSKKIEDLILNPELRNALGKKGYERARNDFSKDYVLSELIRYYREIL